MKGFGWLTMLLVGAAVVIPQANAQSRFGHGSLYVDGYYRDLSRPFGPEPYQNSRFGYGTGRYGFGDSRYGLNSTKFGQQYSPYGSQLSPYGSQYNSYGAVVPRNWTSDNPAYHPITSSLLAQPAKPQQAAATPPQAPATQPKTPATRPVLPPRTDQGATEGLRARD